MGFWPALIWCRRVPAGRSISPSAISRQLRALTLARTAANVKGPRDARRNSLEVSFLSDLRTTLRLSAQCSEEDCGSPHIYGCYNWTATFVVTGRNSRFCSPPSPRASATIRTAPATATSVSRIECPPRGVYNHRVPDPRGAAATSVQVQALPQLPVWHRAAHGVSARTS